MDEPSEERAGEHPAIPLVRTRRKAELENWQLTLLALGIAHHVAPTEVDREWALFVENDSDVERAREALRLATAEQAEKDPASARARLHAAELRDENAVGRLSFSPGLLFAAGLVAVACVAGVGGLQWHDRWFELGANALPLTRSGQWWRTLTALTLHASWIHLAANATCGLFMLPLACELWGDGFGIFLTVLAGALANGAEALLGGQWISLGASTALFGALGLAFGTRLLRKGCSRRERWGIAIVLVILFGLFGLGGGKPLPGGGEGPPVDVSAHALGLAFGLLLGAGARLGIRRRPGAVMQWVYGAASVATVAGAWVWALHPR